MNVTREDVMEALGRNTTRGMSLTAIADAIGARKQDYARLRKLLAELVDEAALVNLGAGLFAPPGKHKAKEPPRPAKIPWGGAPAVKAAPAPTEDRGRKTEAPG